MAQQKPATNYLAGAMGSNPDVTNQKIRLQIIDEIRSAENLSRKRYEQRKFDIYRNRQELYVLERLRDEFDSETVQRMRKVLSINPCKRIVDQLGSIYIREPDRSFSTDDGVLGQDDENEIEDIYHYCGIDPVMRLANRYFKLCDQACIYVRPSDGKIEPRALTPKDYDVIPDCQNPEKAFAYVLNVFNVNLYGPRNIPTKETENRYYSNTRTPETISNDSDRNRLLERYVFWTDEVHFTCNGNGDIMPDGPMIANPIGRLPFIDLAQEKDYQFFVRRGNNIVEFTIDLLVQLCDLAEISRLQGYSQGIVYSINQPKDLVVGPNRVIWMKQPPDGQAAQPKFEFVSPNPDLANALEIINTQLKMFLSSMGLDSSTVSGESPKRAFTSGIDHLLANIDKFQASQEDFDLFRRAETELWSIMRLWLNEYQDVTGDGALDDDLKVGQLDDDIDIEIKFAEPQLVQTQNDKETSVIKRWDNDLLTTKDALKELYGFDDDKAQSYIQELIVDRDTFPRPAIPGLGNPGMEQPPKGAPGQPPANGQPPPNGQQPPANKPPAKGGNVSETNGDGSEDDGE